VLPPQRRLQQVLRRRPAAVIHVHVSMGRSPTMIRGMVFSPNMIPLSMC
jgi:hypothetical protein